jgi:hypothetical protein
LLHPPQCASSVLVSTQLSLQTVWPDGHSQRLAKQICPIGHGMSQPLQWFVSLVVSRHCSPHLVSSEGQTQSPLLHDWPSGHALSHVPQCERSVWVLTQD